MLDTIPAPQHRIALGNWEDAPEASEPESRAVAIATCIARLRSLLRAECMEETVPSLREMRGPVLAVLSVMTDRIAEAV